ncbi:MAG: hypothetical protein CL678_06230 [Bdellovibrionaceae bacterium]|nr:hypothetical protein [Pseudobdellovibrionaceae bacterium]|tara:strand:+ start:2862 stop:3359 length:498 start_codon:yes stop_codon:yes gene_type:complete
MSTGGTHGIETLVAPAINLALLSGLLFWKLKIPVKNGVKARYETIRRDLFDVKNELDNAKKKYEEYSGKLNAIDAELLHLKAQSKESAQAASQSLIQEANRQSESVVSHSKNLSDSLVDELKQSLRDQFVKQVIKSSEEKLIKNLTGDDRQRIRKNFTSLVGGVR